MKGPDAKSAHAGIPWLRYIRLRTGDRAHFWPFDGWKVLPGKSAVVEVYPALWSHSIPRDSRDFHQQDVHTALRSGSAEATWAAVSNSTSARA